MFAFNAFSGSAKPSNESGGGILDTAAPPVFGAQSSGSGGPPVFGSHGAATPLLTTPVFGESGVSSGSGPRAPQQTQSFGVLSGKAGGADTKGIATAAAAAAGSRWPVFAGGAVPLSTVPVFGGPSSTASLPSLESKTSQTAPVFGGSRAAFTAALLPLPPMPPAPTPILSSELRQSSSVFGNATASPFGGRSQTSSSAVMPPPAPIGGPSKPAAGNSSVTGAGPMSPPQLPHRKFDIKPSSATPFGNLSAATAGANTTSSILGSSTSVLAPESKPNDLAKGSNNETTSVLGATPFGRRDAGASALPSYASSAPSPFGAVGLPIVTAMEKNTNRDGPGGADLSGHSRSGGTSAASTQAFSSSNSSFSSPFGRGATAAMPQESSPSTLAATSLSTSQTSSAPASLGNPAVLNSSGSGETESLAAPPVTSAFKAPSVPPTAFPSAAAPPPFPSAKPAPTFGSVANAFGSSAPAAQQPGQQSQPLPAASSVFSAGNAPSAMKSSAFASSTSTAFTKDSQPDTAAKLAPAASPFTALPQTPPAPTAFKSSFGSSAAAVSPPTTSAFTSSPSASQGGRVESGNHRDHGRNRRRSRSPQGAEAAPRVRSEAPQFSIPAPRHVQQQQQQKQQQQRHEPQRVPTTVSRAETISIPSLSPDEKQWSLAARLCKSFLLQLASAAAMGVTTSSASRETGVADALEHAFFGVAVREGIAGNFAVTAGEMLAVWQKHVRPVITANEGKSGGSALPFPGDVWVALFALGTYLNTIVSTLTSPNNPSLSSSKPDLAAYKAGLRDHPDEAFTDACHYANELSELLQMVFQRGSEAEAPPYSVIPVVLRRVRTVFDEANARGVATVQSNLGAVTSKLFAVLNRRVKSHALVPNNTGVPAGKPARWTLIYDSTEKESLLHSFAYLVSEMIAVDAPMSEDVELFVAAFHECLPSALAERCQLYYRHACALLRQPLRMQQAEAAAVLLAKGLAVYPPDAPPSNKRLLEVKLLTAELALGRLPSDTDRYALDVPQLVDVVNALRTSRLDLLDAALKMHGPFFVQVGVHNILMLARQRIALLMVVKYYTTHGCETRLSVADMVRYHRLPYSSSEASMVWLLPLLVEKHMNGVLDHDFLILSDRAPFEDYPRELLASAMQRS